MLSRRSHHLFAALAGVALGGCLETIDPALPTPQATVSFPPRLYLQGTSTLGFCEGLFEGTATTTAALAQLTPLDGSTEPPDRLDVPYNCYVDIAPAARPLPVDVHEVTNAQYQLCVDSGACRAPDPSAVTKEDVCRSESDFDACPVVSVSHQQASDYCEWVGRRLPSGLEQVLVRQSGLAISTGTTSPGFPMQIPLLPIGDTIPTRCEESVLGNGDCRRPFPVMDASGTSGAASGDVVAVAEGRGEGRIYDLVGNVAEVLADLAPTSRGTAAGLPWFCVADLPERATGEMFSPANPPTCPDGAACVYGRYRPAPGMEVDDYPVCIAAAGGQISGFRPVLAGASYFERLVTRPGEADGVRALEAQEAAGVFARRVLEEEDPQRLANTQIGRRTGFRCVGQRASAPEGGRVPEFEDRLTLE